MPKKPQAFKTTAAPFWIESLHLLMSDYNALLNGSWVTDNIANAGQIIIKYTFSHICGLQNILLGMHLQFDVQSTEFVQILHIDGNHWITISTIGCKVGEVNLYVCNQCESHSASTEEQMSCLLNSKEKELQVKIMPVQRQKGCSDCGLFALAQIVGYLHWHLQQHCAVGHAPVTWSTSSLQ